MKLGIGLGIVVLGIALGVSLRPYIGEVSLLFSIAGGMIGGSIVADYFSDLH